MRTITASLFLLTLVTFSAGQNRSDKPNLSGTWRLIEAKNMPKLKDDFTKTLVIVHQEPEIKMATQIKDDGLEKKLEQIYFSDSRGEVNPGFGENQTLKSKTKWRGTKLETRYVLAITVRGPAGEPYNIKLDIAEKWELSKDGNTLTKTVSVSGPPEGRLTNAMGGGSPEEIFSRVE